MSGASITFAAVIAASSDAVIVAGLDGELESATVGIRKTGLGPQLADQEPILEELSRDDLLQSIDQTMEAGDEEIAPDVMDMDPIELRGVVEALLLVSTKVLKLEQICACLPGIDAAYLDGFLRGLSARFTHEQRGWDLREIGGGWQLLTRVDFHPWVRRLGRREIPTKLTRSAMETLAIVAYKQPVIRGDIEDVRGVQCGPMLRQLMDMKLVQVLGRDEETLGHPLLYGTTDIFLDRFGLASPDDLPRSHEFGA